MSAVTRPRGPLPARVYWTRRAVVLGVAFLMVFTLARVLGGGSDGDSDPSDQAAQVSGDPTDSASPSEQQSRQGDGNGDGKGDGNGDRKGDSKKPRKPTLAEPDGPCAPEDVTIEASLSRVASSSEIRIPLKLTTDVPACTFAVSRASVVVRITSGRDRIWSSQECRGIEAETVVVRAEKPAWARLVWNGRRSGIACGPSADWAKPGWYHVTAAPLGGEPTDVMFELTRQEDVVVTETAKPDNEKKGRNGDGDRRR